MALLSKFSLAAALLTVRPTLIIMYECMNLALLELLFIRSGVYQLDNFSVSDVKVLIDSLCTC